MLSFRERLRSRGLSTANLGVAELILSTLPVLTAQDAAHLPMGEF